MKRFAKTMVMVALVLVATSAALAEGPVWSYLEAGYLSVDPDNVSEAGDNWFAGGSVGIFKNFHLFGRYIDGDYSANISNTYWNVGAGWHGLFGDKADLLFEVSWVDTEVGGISDDGYELAGGIRWLPVKVFEADGFVRWADLDQAGSETSYEVRAMINVWKLGIGAAYILADTSDQWNLFARFNFSRD